MATASGSYGNINYMRLQSHSSNLISWQVLSVIVCAVSNLQSCSKRSTIKTMCKTSGIESSESQRTRKSWIALSSKLPLSCAHVSEVAMHALRRSSCATIPNSEDKYDMQHRQHTELCHTLRQWCTVPRSRPGFKVST